MRKVKWDNRFRRDYRRESKGQYKQVLERDLNYVIEILVRDMPLSVRYQDHILKGNWSGYRECHIKPDLVLVYLKVDSDVLRLVRIGSHSELFD